MHSVPHVTDSLNRYETLDPQVEETTPRLLGYPLLFRRRVSKSLSIFHRFPPMVLLT